MKDKLSPVIFTSGNKAISPPLITVREYARWLETVYDEYTCNYELYLRATVEGTKVLEFHPGTRIGKYFDTTTFNNSKYNSWYISQESCIMQKLNKMKLAQYKDVAPIRSDDKKALRLLRLYSIDQIELYVRTKIDRNFCISTHLLPPKKIAVTKCDMKDIIKPVQTKCRKSLLDNKPVQMTIKDIEDKLGYKVSIVS